MSSDMLPVSDSGARWYAVGLSALELWYAVMPPALEL